VLQHAVRAGGSFAVSKVLALGAHPMQTDDSGHSALELVRDLDMPEIAALLAGAAHGRDAPETGGRRI